MPAPSYCGRFNPLGDGAGPAQDDPPPVLEDPATFVSIPSEVGRGRGLIECVRRVHETKFQSPRRWGVVGLKSTRKSKETRR